VEGKFSSRLKKLPEGHSWGRRYIFSAAIAYLFDHEKLFYWSLVSQMNADELKTI
jgi:hypothetical protein